MHQQTRNNREALGTDFKHHYYTPGGSDRYGLPARLRNQLSCLLVAILRLSLLRALCCQVSSEAC